MLSYARSQKSNIYQMLKGYFTFAYNVAKRCVDVLHSMGLCVSYETICIALKENAEEVELKIQDMVWAQPVFYMGFARLIPLIATLTPRREA